MLNNPVLPRASFLWRSFVPDCCRRWRRLRMTSTWAAAQWAGVSTCGRCSDELSARSIAWHWALPRHGVFAQIWGGGSIQGGFQRVAEGLLGSTWACLLSNSPGQHFNKKHCHVNDVRLWICQASLAFPSCCPVHFQSCPRTSNNYFLQLLSAGCFQE